MTLLTALQRRNRLLKLFSFYPKHPKHIAICYSPGTSFLRNINTTFPTGRKECSSPPKRNLLLSHPLRQAGKQNTIGARSARTPSRRAEPIGACLSVGTVQAARPAQGARGCGLQRATTFLLIGQIAFNGCWRSLRKCMNCCAAPSRPRPPNLCEH